MQVFWNCRNLGWAAVFASLVATAGHAQSVNVERMTEEVRRAVGGADRAANPTDRATALEAAAYSLAVLERTRNSADREVQDRAAAAVTELRNEGLSPDLIGFWLVVAKVKGLSASAPAETRLADELAGCTRALPKGSTRPVYRAGAMVAYHALGRALAAAKSPAAARRAADRFSPSPSRSTIAANAPPRRTRLPPSPRRPQI